MERIIQFAASRAEEVNMLILKKTHLSSYLAGVFNANEAEKVVFVVELS